MDLNRSLEILKYDNRMQEWMIKQGVITVEDANKAIANLPDLTNACEPVTLEDKGDFGD